MSPDITLLYYTANIIPDSFASNIRNYLLSISNGISIVSVSQKPIDFGKNICVGDIGQSIPNVYKQILIGAKESKTRFVACCEDDTIHLREHFEQEMESDTFYYNFRWNLTSENFYYRQGRYGMCTCIAPTELLIKNLEEKFEKYNSGSSQVVFAEPGRRERHSEISLVKVKMFSSNDIPSINFKHKKGLSRKSKALKTDIILKSLPRWGNASELWNKFYG